MSAAARFVRRAALAWERDARADVAEGADLSHYLTDYVRRWLPALAAGYVVRDGQALRLTAAGLGLLAADHAARAAERAAHDRMVAESYEVARRERQAYQDRLEQRAQEVAMVDRLQDLLAELAQLRGDLENLDACLPAPGTCSAARPVRARRCRGAAVRSLVCWSRQVSCMEPRRRPILRLLIGGAMEPSPATVRARRAFEEARALHALELAGRRWRQCWMWNRESPVLAGADLRPYLASSRKARRRQRPLYALGYLAQGHMVHEKSPVVLTAAGAAWLAERLRVEVSGGPPPVAVALAA